MKTLAITFAMALTFIVATIGYSYYVESDADTKIITADADWTKVIENRLANLVEENEIVDDLLFDANGNVVMSATYSWQGGNKNGIDKQEYEYKDGVLTRVTSYAWNGAEWQKQISSDVVGTH